MTTCSVAGGANELKRKDGRQDKGAVHALSLAGTAQSTHVYGCVVFDLTLVTNKPETIFSISAKIIDSCIDIIIGRPIIRAYHLVHKIPRYFDEVSRSRPYLSHSDLPVSTSLASANSICAIPCAQCPAFAAHGYDTTLCSLVAGETDHLLDLPDEPRPLVE